MHFLEWKYIDFNQDFNKVYPKGPINNINSIGSDSGLVPTRRQAIIWTNDDYFTDTYASLGLNELNFTKPSKNWTLVMLKLD